jgi:hypothetical protein
LTPERRAKNEVAFRTVNETIDQQAAKSGGLDEYEFICECATTGCLERVALTLAQYAAVRQDGKRFLVVPGHEDIQVELVVESHPTYLVVEKGGAAGEVAEASDPRDGED